MGQYVSIYVNMYTDDGIFKKHHSLTYLLTYIPGSRDATASKTTFGSTSILFSIPAV